MSDFGDTIAQARKQKLLNQNELAALILKEDGTTISPQFINDVERGRREPSEFVIGNLAIVLDLNNDYLCLLAGVIPKDLKEPLRRASPKTVTNAFKAFRRQLREG